MAECFGVVIVGAGHAGVQTALLLRQYGYKRSILLLESEAESPYRRPPLSKAYLKGDVDRSQLAMRSADAFSKNGIDLRCGVTAVQINRSAHHILLSDGSEQTYENLVLALGGTNRRLPVSTEKFLSLRTREDADKIRNAISSTSDVVIVGAGFIGLEVAASLRELGANIVVLEQAPRPLNHAVTAETAEYLTRIHLARGVNIRCDVRLLHCQMLSSDRLRLGTDDGQWCDADIVIVAIGIEPNTEMAKAAGLDVADGIVVDSDLRTSDPAIFAIGDCAAFPGKLSGERLRIESIPNATGHARIVAAFLAGRSVKKNNLPWFWSDQYDSKLQIAGLAKRHDTTRLNGRSNSFSTLLFESGCLVCVESINSPADHAAARKLLENDEPVSLTSLAELDFSLPNRAKLLTRSHFGDGAVTTIV